MSALDLRDLLHKQIDLLEDPDDIHDLFLTVNDFLGHRHLWKKETPEFMEQLRRTVESLRGGAATIPDSQVMREAKEWITK
ncbi:hypothetical protein [Persicitalea jodogahamensis]|uniref:Uncharacterized protein n=1 Tax=Persicitalea jodogahamensis TaxID=402147 RepID=A0A8J3D467_9BACT|nr:hypothetical protein [Persicitalea jodogahamensis]GHB72093.1 hypothetical protein GCM10007390_27670 [Persicitalea jodogahamensis]